MPLFDFHIPREDLIYMSVEGRVHTEERFGGRELTIANNDYFSKCSFGNGVITTKKETVKNVVFKDCNFFNITLSDFFVYKDRMINCTFYNCRLETVSIIDFLLSNVTFTYGLFVDVRFFDTKMYNLIVSEFRVAREVKMTNCQLIGGFQPAAFLSKVDKLSTQFKSAADMLQDVDSKVSSNIIAAEKPAPKATIVVYTKKPHLFLSEGM